MSLGDTAAFDADLCFISLGLSTGQLEWLSERGVNVLPDASVIPLPSGGHPYSRAQTCRPLLREVFPGYICYLWLDSDIVCLEKVGLSFYLEMAQRNSASGVVAMELDSSYVFVRNWQAARAYHKSRFERIERIYGSGMAEKTAYLYQFNSGIFSFHENSSLWEAYERNLQRAIHSEHFGHMSDQDALNVAIVDSNVGIVTADATLNWLCSASLPARDSSRGQWTRPEWPNWPIRLAHLAGRGGKIQVGDQRMTFGQLYKSMGLWKEI